MLHIKQEKKKYKVLETKVINYVENHLLFSLYNIHCPASLAFCECPMKKHR